MQVYNSLFLDIAPHVKATVETSIERLGDGGITMLNLAVPKPDIPTDIAQNYKQVGNVDIFFGKRFLPEFPLPFSTFCCTGIGIKWSLGGVIPASWHPLATGERFTQPRNHSLADPCR